MTVPDDLLVFTLDSRRFAVSLAVVDRVIRMIGITLLPRAPEGVAGIINLHGTVIPVFTMRKRFGLPLRDYELSDQLVIVRTTKRRVALPVDRVSGVIATPGEPVDADAILPSHPYLRGVVKLPDGLVLIHDPDTFLSLDEEADLDDALMNGGNGP